MSLFLFPPSQSYFSRPQTKIKMKSFPPVQSYFQIYFHSDSTVQREGFQLDYSYETCDLAITNETGSVQHVDPGYGRNSYPKGNYS